MVSTPLSNNVLQAHQGYLEGVIRSLFPATRILTDVRKRATITNPNTGYFLELDVWLPDIKLSLEFQDAYHYVTNTWDSHVPIENVFEKDKLKSEVMRSRDETLISVPYWWDTSPQSLIATLQFYRPDLLSDKILSDSPIPLNPDSEYQPMRQEGVPDVGELMLASFPMSLKFTESNIISKRNNWWGGEKYDGIRCCWHPNFKTLFSRVGATIALTPSFVSHLPAACFLDCELWFGRGQFAETQVLLSYGLDSINPSILRMVAFDEPSPSSQLLTFESRYTLLIQNISNTSPFIVTATRMKMKSNTELAKVLKSLLDEGGEGMMLRKPRSIYEHGRSSSLLKLKASRGDREGLVTEVFDNGLSLLLPEGTQFEVPKEDFINYVKPKKGDIVTFSYESVSQRAKPVNMKIYRIRNDVTWREVLRNFSESLAPQILNYTSQLAVSSPPKPFGFWTSEKGKNMRMYLENVAKSLKLPPLEATTWYTMDRSTIMKLKGAKSVLSYYKGSLVKAVIDLFPEISFDEMQFSRATRSFWGNAKNRKQVLENFASSRGFDPLVADHWYKITTADMKYFKGFSSVLNYYQESLTNALVHLFPNVPFDKTKFTNSPRNHWTYPENRRKLFIEFARENHFDPLIASNWYSIPVDNIIKYRGVSAVLTYYKGYGIQNALSSLFPNIGLDPSLFSIMPKGHWLYEKNRKALFKSFAKSRRFDPLIAANWYSVSVSSFTSFRGAPVVLSHYNGSFHLALLELFPNIGLDKSKFVGLSQNYWNSVENRRKLFLNVATQKKFDPNDPEGWYNINFKSLMSFKGGSSIITYYDGDLSKALMDVFPDMVVDQSRFIY